ncbi:MFS siderochrome iron transporter 1 [Psilocybe cubensis]|uniref:MFS siderochrome iron transporter 1 n=2 Tax=Psilocybe cubensis TaxID=181762 RepID=A0ACB8HE48_PSICU|nr:MFS siderochrome iron transporter 1 [Psilocybe cubensis]KAH9486188.1 MFS siderochrome iron transporter 1 [Psilocybe cubensis]
MASNILFSRIRPQADQPIVDSEAEKQSDVESRTPARPIGVVDEQDAQIIDSEQFTPDAQAGVKKIEAVTTVWTKGALYLAYTMIWIIYFVDSMQQSTTTTLTPYVTSSFGKHSTISATGIVSGIVGGLVKLPLAKVLDIWGRPQGYLMMIVLLTVGLVMMAGCNNVETYAAAQVFYWVGYNGLTYTLGIFIADTSTLRNRSFMFAFATSPYLATTWIGGPLADAFLEGPGFRWGFGSFAIITPAITLPLFFVFYLNYSKAEKMGLITRTPSGRTLSESFKHYAVEFDVVGLFLIISGLALFLLPFSLYSYQENTWRSPMIISMLIIGGLLCIAFVFWERYYARVTYIPYSLLLDRTVLGACILSGTLFVSYYLWATYFFSFLMVVNGLSITEASYVGNTYTMGSCFFALFIGVIIRYTGKFKGLTLWFGVPVTMLGVGLMIHFRQPGVNVGYVVMCQIFIAFAGGTCVICEQTAAMAATSHQFVAVVLAMEGMFASVGGAVGQAVAGAIWTGVFPQKLLELLPEESKQYWPVIYGSLGAQLSFPMGTPERDAINAAYGHAQRYMCIASVCILAISWASVLLWKDINVKKFKQVKGTVF